MHYAFAGGVLVGEGADRHMHSKSWFPVVISTQANRFFQPSGIGELVPKLKDLTYFLLVL